MDVPIESLPPAAIEIYKEYKKRQKIVLGWLQQNSQAKNGLTGSQPSLTEFERLTDEISAQAIILPEDIFYSARTMLQMRKEVRSHYRDSHHGHDSCITIFERIVSKLACMPRGIPPPKHTIDLNPSKSGGPQSLNRFTALPSVQLGGLGRDYVALPIESSISASPEPTHGDRATVETNVPGLASHLETVPLGDHHDRLLLLSQVSMIQHQARSICARARTGDVPLHITAYILERAVLLNYHTVVGVWHTVCGPETLNSTFDSVEASLRKVFTECDNLMSEEFRDKFGSLNIDEQMITPLKQLEDFLSTSAQRNTPEDIEESYSRFVKDRPPYARMLSDVTEQGPTHEHMQKLIADLLLNHFSQLAAAKLRFSLSSGSHLLYFVSMMSDRCSLPWRVFWANTLHMLTKTALSFEHGNVTGTRGLGTGLGPAPNCRLKALAFAQEVTKAIVKYMPPKDFRVVGYSTYENLEIFKVRLQIYLKIKRFDLVSQHPAFAGSDILLILDTIYTFGFEQLAFENTFLGPLHVYNALRKVSVLPDIPVLEFFCEKFLDAAFYGSRPSKKFRHAWNLVDDYFNLSESSHIEARILLGHRLNGQMPKFSEKEMKLKTSSRGQTYVPDSRYGYNKRMRANNYSMLHRVYNQDKDTIVPISDATYCQLFGDGATSELPNSIELSDSVESDKEARESFQKIQECKSWSEVKLDLEVLESALVSEENDVLPLIKVNLLKVWHRFYSVFAKADGSSHVYGDYRGSWCIVAALRKCDDIAKERRRDVSDQNIAADESLDWKQVEVWKTAFLEEFEGVTMSDFVWKNL